MPVPSFRTIVEFTRPFTLLPPILGMVSGSFTALGAMRHRTGADLSDIGRRIAEPRTIIVLFLGAILAAALNAGSNIVNQITDVRNDRINKPHRPYVDGRVNLPWALFLAAFFYLVALGVAASIGRETLFVVVLGAIATILYSVPPFRTKRFGIWANVTIASARGCLLKVCGWSCVASVVDDPEPWYVGAVFLLFLIGAASTKDFADIDGDRADGCATWPITYGPRRAAKMMAPFLIVPWLFFPLGAIIPHPVSGRMLSAPPIALTVLAVILAVYGLKIARMILADPDALAKSENHPSWKHMYLQMMCAQIGLGLVYIL